MSPEQFWAISPERFEAYRARWQKKVEREDRQAGLIAWLFAEANRNRTTHPTPFYLEQFMPHTPRKPEIEQRVVADQQKALAEVFKSLAAGGQGEFSYGDK